MPIEMTGITATLKRHLDHYAAEHTKLSTRLTHLVGIPMIVVSIPTALVNPLLAAGLFIGGWAFQFAGHYVFEKNSTAFFGDPVYLLVGPVWVVLEILQMLGLPLPDFLRGDPAGYQAEQPAEPQAQAGDRADDLAAETPFPAVN
jgi:uncharacterized membrane protein YGL010W